MHVDNKILFNKIHLQSIHFKLLFNEHVEHEIDFDLNTFSIVLFYCEFSESTI